MEYGGKEIPRTTSHDVDSESSELVSGEESSFVVVASDTASSGSPALGSIAVESLAGSGIPSLDLVMRSGSKARAEVGVADEAMYQG